MPILIASYLLAKNTEELKVMAIIYVAACLNQWMLVNGVLNLTNGAAGKEELEKTNLVFLFIGKAIVLIVALTFGVQIMGKRIIIPLLIYVLQILVLYFSLNKPNKESEL